MKMKARAVVGLMALAGALLCGQVACGGTSSISGTIPVAQDTQGACDFEEIQLASDGTIERRSLEIGERVVPNTTMNGTVQADEYHYYHVCILRHEHEHQINVQLSVNRDSGGDASVFLSSFEKYPRRGHASWISQHPGNEFVKLYTYLDGFPRKSDVQNRSISLHIGVLGVDEVTTYNLTVSVLDLPITKDIQSREKYYSQLHAVPQASERRRGLRG